MSNVTSMYANNTALNSIRDRGYGDADFDIDTAPLVYFADDDGTEFPSSKSVIYRTDTGAELGVHGHGYKAVAPKHMIDVTRNILERSGLHLGNMQEIIRTSHDGARTFVQYKLPEHTYRTPDGDCAALSLLSISSFDGTWPFMISAAAIQQACTNLQVFVGGEVAVYKAKHTRSLNIEHGGRAITRSLEVFENERELWSKWANRHMTDSQAFVFFAHALKANTAMTLIAEGGTPDTALADLPRRNKSLEYIWNKYIKVYKTRLGANMWSVYNAMTDWSTHAETSRKSSMHNIAAIQNQRQQTVRSAFSKTQLTMVA